MISRIEFFDKKGLSKQVKGYTARDLLDVITYAEVAYWLWYTGQLRENLSYFETESIVEKSGTPIRRASIIKGSIVEKDITVYKQGLSMENYIKSILKGYRLTPIVFSHAFLNFINVYNLENKLDISMLYKRVELGDFN
jgi:hypothetical protein